MITNRIYNSLKIFINIVGKYDLNRTLVGSASLSLQGVTIKVNDIDILCDPKSAIEIGKLLSKYEKQKVQLKENEKFKSYYGIFEIEGIEIEIMGDLKIKNNNKWIKKTRLTSIKKNINYKQIQIPCIPLEQEYQAYLEMGRKEKAKLIKQTIDKHQSLDNFSKKV